MQCHQTSRTVFQHGSVGSGDSDLLQRIRAEPVRVGKRCRRRRGLSIHLGRWAKIFASGLYKPWDVAIDSAGDVFVVIT